MNRFILTVEKLFCGYGENIVLKDFSIDILKNDFVSIIGPNGSGKTTLFKVINRIIKKTSGNILLFDKELEKYSYNEIARLVAFASQNIYLTDMKVLDFVLLGRLPYYDKLQIFEKKSDIDIAYQSMEITDTFRFKDRYITELSSGERQLVTIAKALSQKPELLLLDEPVSHLDIRHQIMVLDLLKRLNLNYGITVLVILHDINLASEYSDKIALINNGKVISFGRPSEVLTKEVVKNVYDIDIAVSANPLSGKPCIFYYSNKGSV